MDDSVIALNTQGFFPKEITQFANRHQPAALVLTEHKQSDLRNLDQIDGYTLAAGYAASTKQRGVGILVRNDVPFVQRPDLDSFAAEREFEMANVELPTKRTVVTGQYRSPSSSKINYNDRLDEFAKYVSMEPNKKHVIAGDINIDSRKNTTTKQVLKDNGLKFNVRSSTHDGGSCLDNFITNYQPSQSRVMSNYQLSDHRPIKISLNSATSKTPRGGPAPYNPRGSKSSGWSDWRYSGGARYRFCSQ